MDETIGISVAHASSTEPLWSTPGMAWRDIAASVYRAYAASTGNKNFKGDPMPAFGDLPIAIQTAWEAAARHTGVLSRFSPDTSSERMAEAEQKWNGWTSPGIRFESRNTTDED